MTAVASTLLSEEHSPSVLVGSSRTADASAPSPFRFVFVPSGLSWPISGCSNPWVGPQGHSHPWGHSPLEQSAFRDLSGDVCVRRWLCRSWPLRGQRDPIGQEHQTNKQHTNEGAQK